METIESTHAAWERLRQLALARDGNRCTVARLLGGTCHALLDVHHLVPVAEGGAPLDLDNVITACRRHHPMLEAIRRAVLRRREPRLKRCKHFHPYAQGRVECERRLNEAVAA